MTRVFFTFFKVPPKLPRNAASASYDSEGQIQSRLEEMIRLEELSNKNRQETLDREKRIVDKSGVQKRISSWPELLREVKRRTKERGIKAALARELKVTRQAVDQWLSGTSKPSAETTLELLNWVENPK